MSELARRVRERRAALGLSQEELAERVARLLTEEMEGVMSLSVPLVAEAHWGKNWLEAK